MNDFVRDVGKRFIERKGELTTNNFMPVIKRTELHLERQMEDEEGAVFAGKTPKEKAIIRRQLEIQRQEQMHKQAILENRSQLSAKDRKLKDMQSSLDPYKYGTTLRNSSNPSITGSARNNALAQSRDFEGDATIESRYESTQKKPKQQNLEASYRDYPTQTINSMNLNSSLASPSPERRRTDRQRSQPGFQLARRPAPPHEQLDLQRRAAQRVRLEAQLPVLGRQPADPRQWHLRHQQLRPPLRRRRSGSHGRHARDHGAHQPPGEESSCSFAADARPVSLRRAQDARLLRPETQRNGRRLLPRRLRGSGRLASRRLRRPRSDHHKTDPKERQQRDARSHGRVQEVPHEPPRLPDRQHLALQRCGQYDPLTQLQPCTRTPPPASATPARTSVSSR